MFNVVVHQAVACSACAFYRLNATLTVFNKRSNVANVFNYSTKLGQSLQTQIKISVMPCVKASYVKVLKCYVKHTEVPVIVSWYIQSHSNCSK